MKKKYRLLKNYQFKDLIAKGKSISNQEFLIYYQYRNDFGKIRIGISVPKKRVSRAFARNKIKRQIKNMLTNVKKDWAVDIVIIIKAKYLKNNYESNLISLKNLLTKIPLKVG